MGYLLHHAIVVTGFMPEVGALRDAVLAAARVRSLSHVVSQLLPAACNGWQTFLVGPDGSKEGYRLSHEGDALRDEVITLCEATRYEDGSSPVDWVEIQYGDDDGETYCTRDSDEPSRRSREEDSS